MLCRIEVAEVLSIDLECDGLLLTSLEPYLLEALELLYLWV